MRDLDRYQTDYASLPFEAMQARYRRRRVLENLARFQAKRILEVGCGLEPLFLHYTGFDAMHVIEPGQAFHARALAAAQDRAGVSVHAGTLEQVAPRLRAESFDSIVLSSLLHEVPHPADLLSATRALCAPDTRVHVYVPNAHSLHRLLALEMGLIRDVHELSATQQRMQQNATYDAVTLTEQLEAAGFETLECGSFFIKPFTHAQMAAMQQQGILTEAMLEGLYALSERLPKLGSELYAIARRKPA